MRKRGRNFVLYCGFIKRFQGVGIMLDLDPPYAMREEYFEFELRLLWFKVWWIVFKPNKKQAI